MKLNPPDRLVSPINLRLRALDLVGSGDDRPLVPREIVTLGAIVGKTLHSQDNALTTYIESEFESLKLPRYTALVSLLAPYGLVGQYPTEVMRMASYLLGDTRQVEEAGVNWTELRRRHPRVNFDL